MDVVSAAAISTTTAMRTECSEATETAASTVTTCVGTAHSAATTTMTHAITARLTTTHVHVYSVAVLHPKAVVMALSTTDRAAPGLLFPLFLPAHSVLTAVVLSRNQPTFSTVQAQDTPLAAAHQAVHSMTMRLHVRSEAVLQAHLSAAETHLPAHSAEAQQPKEAMAFSAEEDKKTIKQANTFIYTIYTIHSKGIIRRLSPDDNPFSFQCQSLSLSVLKACKSSPLHYPFCGFHSWVSCNTRFEWPC